MDVVLQNLIHPADYIPEEESNESFKIISERRNRSRIGDDGSMILSKLTYDKLLGRPNLADDGALAPQLLTLWSHNAARMYGKKKLPFRMKGNVTEEKTTEKNQIEKNKNKDCVKEDEDAKNHAQKMVDVEDHPQAEEDEDHPQEEGVEDHPQEEGVEDHPQLEEGAEDHPQPEEGTEKNPQAEEVAIDFPQAEKGAEDHPHPEEDIELVRDESRRDSIIPGRLSIDPEENNPEINKELIKQDDPGEDHPQEDNPLPNFEAEEDLIQQNEPGFNEELVQMGSPSRSEDDGSEFSLGAVNDLEEAREDDMEIDPRQMQGDELLSSKTKWHKHTVKVFEMLKRNMNTSGGREHLNFDKLSNGCSRRTASSVFFELLQLKTWDFIELEQKQSYCDIKIIPGDRFSEEAPSD